MTATEVTRHIYRSWLNCPIDAGTDEGLETSDHFSFHRLSLKTPRFVKVTQREEGGSIVILMDLYCAAAKSQNRKQREASKRRQKQLEREKKKPILVVKDIVDGTWTCFSKEVLPIKWEQSAVPLPVLALCLSTTMQI